MRSPSLFPRGQSQQPGNPHSGATTPQSEALPPPRRATIVFGATGGPSGGRFEALLIPGGGGCIGTPAFGDYDNDGRSDRFVADGEGVCRLHHNDVGGIFTPVDPQPLTRENGLSTGAAWGDLDNDGFLDLAVAMEDDGNRLFRNRTNSNA